jgi:hypothetical protein
MLAANGRPYGCFAGAVIDRPLTFIYLRNSALLNFNIHSQFSILNSQFVFHISL